jgi:hypothetical protein
MFRDDVQASRAIRLLLAEQSLDRLWGEEGPTNAILLRYEHDLHLPPAKRALLLAAWSLWTPISPSIAFGELVRMLDRASSEALCSLVVAYNTGAEAVDAWIDTARARRGPSPPGDSYGALVPGSIIEGWPTLDLLSVRYAERVLSHTNGNRTRAAAVLGVDRRTVARLLAMGGGGPRLKKT